MVEPLVVEEGDTASLDTVALADRLDASVVAQLRLDAERFALVAAWADHHPVVEGRQVPYGAEGTPAVAQFAAEELGCLLRTTTYRAASELREVLDLRHRMPVHYAAVLSGELEGWKARLVVRATRELSLVACRQVDRVTVAATLGLPFGRARDAVEAAVIAVDPVAHEQARALEAEQQYVATGRPSNRFGLRTMIARGPAGTIARLDAMLTHLADLLAAAGDPDPVPVRRATALGYLANPALACVFLAGAHPAQTQPEPEAGPAPAEPPAEVAEPPADPGEPGDPVKLSELSAVEAAVLVGRALQSLGGQALDRLRPTSVLYLHLSQEAVQGIEGAQVARVEGIGPIGVEQLREWLREWLGTDQVTVRPVLDPAGVPALDGYEVRGELREAVQLVHPFEMFPWGTLQSRSADKDHTEAYVPLDQGGPPGQTRLDNIGPLGRGHHQGRTAGAFTCHQPLPGMFLWRTPTGHWYQVDHHGTHPLGRTTPAILRQRQHPARTSRMDAHFTGIIDAA